MKHFIRHCSPLLASLLLATAPLRAEMPASISAYPVPELYRSAASPYELAVNGTKVPVVAYTDEYDYAAFQSSSPTAEIEITLPGKSQLASVSVSPRRLGISAHVDGNRVRFTAPGAQYLIVQVDQMKRLVIVADPAEVEHPDPKQPGTFDVTASDFGADRSGSTLSTSAIQRAIDQASAYGARHGEGLVYVPAGLYRIGNLVVKSNTALYLAPGAVLRAADDPNRLTPHWYKHSQRRYITWLISTEPGAHHVRLFGRGTIDGNAKYLIEAKNVGDNVLVPLACANFSVDGLTFRDSGSWAVTPVRSHDIRFTNCKIFNRLNGRENDGIDACECQNVEVRHTLAIANDDPFSTKTWAEDTDIAVRWPGSPQPNRAIRFDDCVAWTRCFGFKVGEGTRQEQDDITFSNGIVYDCGVGIGINHKYGTAVVHHIVFDHIDIERVTSRAHGISSWAGFLILNAVNDGGKKGVVDAAGPIKGLNIQHLRVYDRGRAGAVFKGFSETSSISDVTFTDVIMPGQTRPAASLADLDVQSIAFLTNVKFKDGSAR